MASRHKKNEGGKAPVYRVGPVWTGNASVEVAVFETSGEKKGHYLTLQRSYKKGEEWENQHLMLFPQDALPLAELIRDAWGFVQSDK